MIAALDTTCQPGSGDIPPAGAKWEEANPNFRHRPFAAGHRAALQKELTVMNMWGLAIAIGIIVIVTVIMGLIATHGSYQKPHH